MQQFYHRNTRAEENICGKSDNSVNMVFFDKVSSNLFLFATSEENAVRQNDSHNTVWLNMIEVVK